MRHGVWKRTGPSGFFLEGGKKKKKKKKRIKEGHGTSGGLGGYIPRQELLLVT
jgi:hypothetical protein